MESGVRPVDRDTHNAHVDSSHEELHETRRGASTPNRSALHLRAPGGRRTSRHVWSATQYLGHRQCHPRRPTQFAYRHLSDLQVAGVVRRIAANDEFARFELAEDLTHHHHHLLCSSCGRVIDVTPTLDFERTVSAMVDELARQQGFRASSHALDVIGHCAACQGT